MEMMAEWKKRLRWACVRYPDDYQSPPQDPQEWENWITDLVGRVPKRSCAAAQKAVRAVPRGDWTEVLVAVLAVCPPEFREKVVQGAEDGVEYCRDLWEKTRSGREFDRRLREAGVGLPETGYREYWRDFRDGPIGLLHSTPPDEVSAT